MNTIGNCQRSVFSLVVAQHMHKITNLCKFEHNWSRSCEIIMKEKNTLVTRGCVLLHVDACFSRPQILNLRSQNQICGKLLLSRKLHFRGSRFSQCFVQSTSPHYSLPSEVLYILIILSKYQQCPLPLRRGLFLLQMLLPLSVFQIEISWLVAV